MSKTRLTALFSVLLLASRRGGPRRRLRQQQQRAPPAVAANERRTAHRRLRHPLSAVRAIGETKANYTGFDVELMEAIGEKIGRDPEFQDTSFETIFRDVAQGKFEAVSRRRRSPKNAKKTSPSPNPYYLSEQAILVKEGSDDRRPGRPRRQDRRRPAGHHRPGTRQGKSRTPANSAPTREGPDAINALKAGTVEAVIIDAPVARERGRRRRRGRNRRKSPDRRKVRNRGRQGQRRTARRNQRRAWKK